ncbi:MAG: multicomponent K+:H+ antiporter subunit D [Gammaproteobacteria bacterium]
MNHWIIAPVILPALVAGVLALTSERRELQRKVGGVSVVLQVLIACVLVGQAAQNEVLVYALGNWQAPFGIALVLDRLSAIMLLTSAVLAAFCLFHAMRGEDVQGRFFHPLFQFQLMGLNGAFLTGDLFNLFVFFEVLLISSYGLLLHGGGAPRMRAGLHYVVLNLLGSLLFLIGVGALYGITGTLNMADLADKLMLLEGPAALVAQSAAFLLLVVFALKAAAFPMYMWLPDAYASAMAPVAALFAIMTKVGVYAIVRVHIVVFAPTAGLAAPNVGLWLLPVGLITMVLATLGAIASPDLRRLIAYLTLLSVGILLSLIGAKGTDGLGAVLYYLVHSTLASAALFLIAGLVRESRGVAEDRLTRKGARVLPASLGALFLLAAAAIAGLPPLSGFLGKIMVLQAAGQGVAAVWLWTALLVTSFFAVLTLARAGIVLFWEARPYAGGGVAVQGGSLPTIGLLACLIMMSIFASPVKQFTDAAAGQLADRDGYISSVLKR